MPPARRDALLLTALFIASRLLARARGVRFDTSPLEYAWQLLDPELLRHDLLRSLWLLHAQPPLLNGLAGAALKLSAGAPGPLLAGLFALAGLALLHGLYRLARRLGAARGPALLAAAVFSLSPSAIAYENLLFYTHLEAALLCLTCLAALRAQRAATTGSVAAVAAGVVALALLRPLFHLAWVLLVLAAVGRAAWGRLPRRRLLALLAAGALLPGAVYLKNAALFGSFSASSWVGMNLARLARTSLDGAEVEALVASGRASPLLRVVPFSPLAKQPPGWREAPPRGHPALDAPTKANGTPNFNAAAYLGISRQLGRDARAAILAHPGEVARSLVQGWIIFANPSGHYPFVSGNLERLMDLEEVYCDYVYLQAGPVTYLLFLVVVPLALLLLLAEAWRRPGRAFALLLVLAQVGFVAVVSNSLEFGENQRFKFTCEPLLFAALAVLLTRLGAWARALGRWLAALARTHAPAPGERLVVGRRSGR